LAIQFAKRGAHLILWDCDSEANNKTLETLKLRGYKKAELFTVDLSDEKQLKNTAQLVRQKFGNSSNTHEKSSVPIIFTNEMWNAISFFFIWVLVFVVLATTACTEV
jgi:NAD(P)-dependent dehydrogenase (short-subunit alcohol dehydrogenase family)